MNTEQIASIIRQIFLFFGGIAVGKGYVDQETMVQIVGGLVAVIGGGWALWSRTDKNIVASAATKVDVPVSEQKAVGITTPVSPAK